MVKKEYEWVLNELNRIYKGLIEYEHVYVIEGFEKLRNELLKTKYSNKQSKLTQNQAERIRDFKIEMNSGDLRTRSFFLKARESEGVSILYLAKPEKLEVITEEVFHATSPLPTNCDEAYVPFAKYLILKSAENKGFISLEKRELIERSLGGIDKVDKGYYYIYDSERDEEIYAGRTYTSKFLSVLELTSTGKKMSLKQQETFCRNLLRIILKSNEDCGKVFENELNKLKNDNEEYINKLI
jgi:hypothetical protein